MRPRIDPSEGEVDGRVAISFWPHGGGGEEDLLDPAGFEVHLVPSGRFDEELTLPCGTWLAPPVGKYRYWLEGPNLISPWSLLVSYRGGAFRGRGGASIAPVVAAGRVALDPALAPHPELEMRLLAVESHNRGLGLGREMARRVPGARCHEGVRMPVGPVLAALFDPRSEEFVGLARPIEARPGEDARVRPELPVGATHLLVVLERPDLVSDPTLDDVLPTVTVGDRVREPDLRIPALERVFAVWWDLDGRYGTLEVSSASVRLPPVEIPLRAGRVESFRGSLQPLPGLDVELRLPPELTRSPLRLSVRTRDTRRELGSASLPPEASHHRFERLPAEPLEVLLDAPPWLLGERVDLSDGKDVSLIFEPRPLVVEGKVYQGHRPVSATVGFRTNRNPTDKVFAQADDQGRYRAVLYRPGGYATFVYLEGPEGRPPFLGYQYIEASQTLDFHLPDNALEIRVTDTEGDRLAGAEVVADNRFPGEGGRVRTSSNVAITDEQGVARLPPLLPGEVIVRARAKGFERSEVRESVSEEPFERQMIIVLRRFGEGAALRLVLPDGSPAAGAEVQARPDLADAPPTWTGSADARGTVSLPVEVAGSFLLARHRLSGAAVRPAPVGGEGSGAATWVLPLPGAPLTLLAKRSWGDPVPWAGIAVWIDGLRVSGNSLAWLTHTFTASAGRDGIWRARGLPRGDLPVLVWAPEAAGPAVAGAYDSLAKILMAPWPDKVEVEAID